MHAIDRNTCIRFVQRKPGGYADYVDIQNQSGQGLVALGKARGEMWSQMQYSHQQKFMVGMKFCVVVNQVKVFFIEATNILSLFIKSGYLIIFSFYSFFDAINACT